jgi:hypothetical protein
MTSIGKSHGLPTVRKYSLALSPEVVNHDLLPDMGRMTL